MGRIKDIPKVDRPREKFLKKGPDALSKSDLLAILIGSGVKGKNVREIAEQVIKKFGNSFLTVTVNDLRKIRGLGEAKSLQIAAAISLVKRFYDERDGSEIVISSAQDVINLNSELREKKKEYLVCLYLNARNCLLKKEIVSIGTIDKSIIHPREVFAPAIELRSSAVILVHNHPSGDSKPSTQDLDIIRKISEAGKLLDISVLDFLIIAQDGFYSFRGSLGDKEIKEVAYISDETQYSLFDLLKIDLPDYSYPASKIKTTYFCPKEIGSNGKFHMQNRRFLGNKYKLVGFIDDIVKQKCGHFESFCDIFSGTGVVGKRFNEKHVKIISNDILFSNYISLKTFLGARKINLEKLNDKINRLNSLKIGDDNYFSINFGNTYFTVDNAKKIGHIRELIDEIAEEEEEKFALITSLIYAADKVANTVGHYDAYRKKLDTIRPLKLLIPDIQQESNENNEIYREDANQLIRRISCDILYIDPPYNSRQYCDTYHLLENLAVWDKPLLYGKAKKMNRNDLKSQYCCRTASKAFFDLIQNANCRHILVSYNNTGESKDGRSNARIKDQEIIELLRQKGEVEVFEREYKAFTTGKSDTGGHTERIFHCKVIK
jgi:adenine-specific DNA-methyltransferase